MYKLVFTLLVLYTTTIFAQRPDWFPENPREIEAKCAQENAISPETMAQILAFNLEDTQPVRAYLFCSAKNKNFYGSNGVFIPERLQYSLTDIAHMDCNIDVIRNCDNNYRDLQPEDLRYFNILRCIVANREGNCKRIV